MTSIFSQVSYNAFIEKHYTVESLFFDPSDDSNQDFFPFAAILETEKHPRFFESISVPLSGSKNRDSTKPAKKRQSWADSKVTWHVTSIFCKPRLPRKTRTNKQTYNCWSNPYETRKIGSILGSVVFIRVIYLTTNLSSRMNSIFLSWVLVVFTGVWRNYLFLETSVASQN